MFDDPKTRGENDFLKSVPLTCSPYIQKKATNLWRQGWIQAFKLTVLDYHQHVFKKVQNER